MEGKGVNSPYKSYQRSSLHTSRVSHQAGAYPDFCIKKRLGVFLLPLDGCQSTTLSLSVPIYTPGWRGTVRVKCLVQGHNTMSPARARTRTARSGGERTNHEATSPCTQGKTSQVIFRHGSQLFQR